MVNPLAIVGRAEATQPPFSHLHFRVQRFDSCKVRPQWKRGIPNGMLRKQGLAGNFIFPICACPAVCFALSHLCTLPPNHLNRLDVLRKGPGLPGLTVASEVPGIITDYDCSSWLNGKRPAKSRETKTWLIMVHSFDNFIRSELTAWKSDMAGKEIGKRRKSDRTILYHNSTNAI